jgi:hypothetical protein
MDLSKYSYLKIPILIHFSYSLKKDLLTGLEAGIQLSYFIEKDYHYLYNDGSKKDKFPFGPDFPSTIYLAFKKLQLKQK